MKKILLLGLTGITLLAANSYDDFIDDLSGDMRTYMSTPPSKHTLAPTNATKHSKVIVTSNQQSNNTKITKEIDKKIKEVKKSNEVLSKQVKEVKKSVKKIEKNVQQSNATLAKEVKKSNATLAKKIEKSNKKTVYVSSKNVIPVAAINEDTHNKTNNFLYFGFGYQGLSVEDKNGYFGEFALDDSAIDIKAGYGQYFEVSTTKLFATAGFEYLSLKQADMKAITASINTQTEFNKDTTGYIGLKVGYSYLVWDIQQDEAIESITSSSPLVGIQAGIEYKIDDSMSIVFGVDYTKYFHETQIPLDTLNTNSAYGINISLRFYQ